MSVTWTYIGHGTHQFALSGQTVLADPFLNDNPAARAPGVEGCVPDPGEDLTV